MSYEYPSPVSQEERDQYALELSERAVACDPDCIPEIFTTFYGPVVGLLRRKADPQIAEDLAQETFIKAQEAIEDGRFTTPGKKALVNWLFRIASNKAHDANKRKNYRAHAVPIDFQEVPDFRQPTVDDFSPRVDDAYGSDDFVVRVTDGMNPDFRDLLLAVDINGDSYAEAADKLGIPLGTVRSRLNRARTVLSETVKQQSAE